MGPETGYTLVVTVELRANDYDDRHRTDISRQMQVASVDRTTLQDMVEFADDVVVTMFKAHTNA